MLDRSPRILLRSSLQRGLPHRRSGFTLTELLVAVAILIVVIVATARIFGTVSKVTGQGEANADLLQTAQTLEKQMRADIERLSRDGFLVIRNVEVPNDVNVAAFGNAAPLLNPAAPAGALYRCDQLLFFTEGLQTSTQFSGSRGIDPPSGGETGAQLPVHQASSQRVYYGHGFQLRNAPPAGDLPLAGMENGEPVLPWTFSPIGNSDYRFDAVRWDTGTLAKPGVIATQPNAREWIVARQSLLLAEDGLNGFTRYNVGSLDAKNSTAAIWATTTSPTGANFDPGPLSSRVDIAASTLDRIRQVVTGLGGSNWNAQRTQILRSISVPAAPIPIRYPRVEKVAPAGSTERIDQMLTNPAIAYGCSSFIVEWTWADGVGRQKDANGITLDPTPAQPLSGDEWVGFVLNDRAEQPWFGLNDVSRGVAPLSTISLYTGSCGVSASEPGCLGLPIYAANIESTTPVFGIPGLNGVRVYQATFGYNQTRGVVKNTNTNITAPDPALGFTPWPTALRITFTLHDPQQRFPEGRTFQFVVELPKR